MKLLCASILRRGLPVALLALGACGALAYRSYPGVTLGLMAQARSATFAETSNLFRCILYWLKYMEHIEVDPATGDYTFTAAVAARARGLDTCTLTFHRGDFDGAVACTSALIDSDGESEERLFWLAMSLLRAAETQNCLEASNPPLPRSRPATARHDHPAGLRQGMCTLPLGTPHEQTTLARQAAETFERLLDRHDSDDLLWRWLLNFAHMTIGDFPDGVPERYRVSTPFIDRFYGEERERLAQKYRELRFVDRAPELGVATLNAGRGVAVEDFDGDGYLDLVTGGSFEDVRYYRNVLGRRFEDRTAEAGLEGTTQPFAISAADFDNDGLVDLFIGRPFHSYRLYRNRGGARFVDVTRETGLEALRSENETAASWTAAWSDIDLDGDLDLFLAQWGMSLPFVGGFLERPRMDSKLLLNEGGRFVDRTEENGLSRIVADQYFAGATFGDYDSDGDADLFLSSPVRLASTLMTNDGDGRFKRSRAAQRLESGFYAAFLDIDHDGLLDLFQGGFGDARTSTEMTVFERGLDRYTSGHSTILHQQADGGFEERNEAFAGDMPMATMGASFGDINNDGCFDFYLGTGNPEAWFVLPNLMYVGRVDGRRCLGELDNVSMLAGFGTIQKGHGIVFFDFDNDGDQDVYSSLGGMWPADAWPNQLLVNESSIDRSWLKLRLRGRKSNRFGVGARVTVLAKNREGKRIERRFQMDSGTGFGSSPYLLHVGLLDAIDSALIDVEWPASGCMSRHVAGLRNLTLVEEPDCGLENGT